MTPSDAAVRLLRFPEVKARYPRSRSQIFRDIEAGKFPPGVHLGARCTGWIESEINQVLRARIAGTSDAELRELVAHLVAARTQAPAPLAA